MTPGQHAATFAGHPVRGYDPQRGPGLACRIALDYAAWEAGTRLTDRLATLFDDPRASSLEALVIGAWDFDGTSTSAAIVESLCAARAKLTGLRAILLGDMTADELPLAWIRHHDVSPLLDAYPRLETLHVRGGRGLVLARPGHARLRSLVLESAGLAASTVRAIASAHWPSLTSLALWTGREPTYVDLFPLLAARTVPHLAHLAVRNAVCADALAQRIVGAPVLPRLVSLDLSLGTLSDAGGEALLRHADALGHLRALDLHHHFMSASTVRRLVRRFGFAVDTSGAHDPDEPRACAVTA